jgi:GMP synthase PP-ATPase subunit
VNGAAVLLPVRRWGVMGDGRTHDQACALRRGKSNRRNDGEVLIYELYLQLAV